MQGKGIWAALAMRLGALGILTLAALSCRNTAAAEPKILPVPSITIYPGDVIQEHSLVDRDFSADPVMSNSAGMSTRAGILGKVARRTLLPGLPIPLNAIAAPAVVSNGTKVRILFEEGPLRITAYGTALQSGGAGDIISVRNISSGLTVSGTVHADGSVHVGSS
ncbi:MAG: flagellar basal body P-ring formation chaperone FlgA [Beijerinckiaceae bacterium]|nr:flagellar basal body P-ring formation chaperone FlgA [Beijerinckiaceae bacterium]MCI0734833.1 flagellar basal body P-ring formation chaperone FlgA [Beijerinckiaceae bacterium]